jgi:hypothetical protein
MKTLTQTTKRNGDLEVAVGPLATREGRQAISINPPNIKTAHFTIEGTAPLVIHRFDEKVKSDFRAKIIEGSKPRGKNKFAPKDTDDICEAAKYFGMTKGKKWEGFNASGVRLAMISACRGANFKMTIAKQSLFVEADGWDIYTPLIPLVRIIGTSQKSEMIAKTETGIAMLCIRPMYNPWSAHLRIRFDADLFGIGDVTNLLARAGQCVGICEGRPDSKNSGGMGWGTFQIVNSTTDEK